ncbi:4-hydroxy-tetrahydrodipicolinate synthase [Coxiella burnetii]|nr:4-hydroxy-tetrahydrodipicolinate synthase [Coxiella burnetii]NP_820217.2 dihydrodipicolinate synthase [Coxiella burnetii RSA 493]ABS77900.2 dihydrodipicolinate synthase [Coxiella burnetii Dugway 5J108-111]ACJ18184.1 dihydrodipicolinate synthase [Coxiella burnetii CbuG_Q212]ACJ20281.1 dihydrodipicolinate synthase [Coxiella burnetii CbuK_Q154]AAO90731.2 dihydrodipicolinate synthase [Coxiella burnetii RSA 493]ARI66015.1 4-hydroxy-tetrahydrodipicolinate synthase [Coxiella burnetii]
MTEKRMNGMFNGSLVALVTPMQENGEIDYSNLKELVEWHLENDTDGLVILGTTGESPTITAEERHKIIRQVVDQVNKKIPIIVGTGANSTVHTIEMTQQAMELGADAALIVTPYYNKPTQEGLFQYFKTIAEAVPIAQILYNVPSRTACDLLPETVIRIAKCSNVVGLKEATGDIQRVKQLKAEDLDLLSGDDKTAMDFMLAGGKGVISVVANVVPKPYHAFCITAVSGNVELAKKENDQLSPLYDSLFVESNPIPVKWALSQMGVIPKGIRLPLTPLSERYHAKVRESLQQVGIKC